MGYRYIEEHERHRHYERANQQRQKPRPAKKAYSLSRRRASAGSPRTPDVLKQCKLPSGPALWHRTNFSWLCPAEYKAELHDTVQV